MISAPEFVSILKNKKLTSFTGVPCSFFQSAINCVLDDPDLRYVMVPNEGSALALASGSYLAGRPAVVMIQNSGLGNLVNPLTSLNMIYGLPVLIFMSGRAYGVPDEPQHEIIGRTMGALLDAVGVPHADMPSAAADFEKALGAALARMESDRTPFFFFVRKGTIEEYARPRTANAYPLKRIDAIRLVAEALSGDEAVIATTGMPSRELFNVQDRARNFYMQGSMGHAPSIGLGIALADPSKKVVVLDGDGALLMHMGVLSSVGHYKPKNFYHIVLDNEAYETTGDQGTTAATTDFKAAAKAAGYVWTEECSAPADTGACLNAMLKAVGPAFLRIKINRLPTEGIPRISTKYDSPAIARNFRSALEKNA